MLGLSIKNSVEFLSDKDYYFDRLERLFFIGEGEIIGYYEDGSRIMNYFWEPANERTIRNIIFEVKRLIYKYEPDLNLMSASAAFVPLDSNEMLLIIEIEFTTKQSPIDQKTLTFTKVRG